MSLFLISVDTHKLSTASKSLTDNISQLSKPIVEKQGDRFVTEQDAGKIVLSDKPQEIIDPKALKANDKDSKPLQDLRFGTESGWRGRWDLYWTVSWTPTGQGESRSRMTQCH